MFTFFSYLPNYTHPQLVCCNAPEFLHWFEVFDAANATLKLLPVNAGPMRSVDTMTTVAMIKLTVDTFLFMVKLMLKIIL
jgi:hypothetical protein